MKLYAFLTATLAAYALLHFFVLPEMDRKWAANRTIAKLSKAGVLAALKAARTLLQIALVTYGLILLVASVLGLFLDTGAAADYQTAIETVEIWKASLSSFQSGILGPVSFGLAILALAILAYRRHRQDLLDEVQVVISREVERLRAEFDQGKWPSLPPTEEMDVLAARIHMTERLLEAASADEASRGVQAAGSDFQRAIDAMKNRWVDLDFVRRMDLTSTPTEAKPAHESIWWPRLRTFFTSKSVVADTSLVAKGCSQFGTMFLFIALLGVNTPIVADALAHRIDSLWELEVKASREEAKQSWAKVAGREKEANRPSLTPAEMERVNQLARLFVQAYLSSPELRQNALVELHAAVVREQVVDKIAGPADGKSLVKTGGFSSGGLDEREKGVVKMVQESVRKPASSSSIEAWATRKLQTEVAGKYEGLWTTFQGKLDAHLRGYGEPAKSAGFARIVLGQLLDPVAEAASKEFDVEYLKQSQKLVTKGVKVAAERAIETKFQRFLVDMAGSGSLEDALARIRAKQPGFAVFTPKEIEAIRTAAAPAASPAEAVIQKLKATPVSIAQATESGIDGNRVGKLLGLPNVRTGPPNPIKAIEVRESSAGMVTSYEDLFPGQRGSQTDTLRSRVLKAAGFDISAGQLDATFERARSFAKLNTFHRVGGVVIGREPGQDGLAHVDVRDVRWDEDVQGRMRLSLILAGIGSIPIGPVLTEVIRQALAYAADGRSLAVTIVNTEIVGAQKIILHPVLVDSPLGCEFIEIDKFVFHYGDPATMSKQSRELDAARSADALYRFARLHRLRPHAMEESKANIDTQTTELVVREDQDLQRGLLDVTRFEGSNRSPFAKLTDIYDSELVGMMKRCLDDAERLLNEFGLCIANASRAVQVDESRWTILRESPAKMNLVSAVRDNEYDVDPQLTFLSPPTTGAANDLLWPLNFFIQATYESGVRHTESAWDFPYLQDAITQSVAGLVQTNDVARAIVADVGSFTVLQRLFRLAFRGSLGEDFPLEKLVALAEIVASPAVSGYQTPRWEVSGSVEDVMKDVIIEFKRLLGLTSSASLASARGLKWVDIARQRMDRCVKLLESKAPGGTIALDEWDRACRLEEFEAQAKQDCPGEGNTERSDTIACVVRQAVQFSEYVSWQRELREAVQVPSSAPHTKTTQSPKSCRPSS